MVWMDNHIYLKRTSIQGRTQYKIVNSTRFGMDFNIARHSHKLPY